MSQQRSAPEPNATPESTIRPGAPMWPRDGALTNGKAATPGPLLAGVAAEAAAGDVTDVKLEDFNGASLLVSDARVAQLLANETRDRIVERLFGVSRDQSRLVALIALGMLAQAAHEKADQMLKGPGGPYPSDFALAGVALRELLFGIGGPSSPNTLLFGTLLTMAVAGAVVRPALSRTVRGIGASSHRIRLVFNHRYGHLIDPSRRRDGGAQFGEST